MWYDIKEDGFTFTEGGFLANDYSSREHRKRHGPSA